MPLGHVDFDVCYKSDGLTNPFPGCKFFCSADARMKWNVDLVSRSVKCNDDFVTVLDGDMDEDD